MKQPRLPNDRLRHQRERRGWSQKRVAEELEKRFAESGASPKDIGRWERGARIPRPFYRERLCLLYGCTADQLGFVDLPEEEEPEEMHSLYPTIVDSEQASDEQGDIMAKFNRRTFLEATAAITLAPGALSALTRQGGVDESILQQFESLNNVCWNLSNSDQLEMTAQILGIYLPKITVATQHTVAIQHSPQRSQAASLAARGYILAAEVEKQDVAAMQTHAAAGVFYSQFTDDYNVQCNALRQDATIALVARQPFKALLSYQKALPLVDKVTPLLRSRIYLGLASAFARCNPVLYKQEALRYLGMAQEHFPAEPEKDPNYLYMYMSASKPALHLYEALTFADLKQPKDTWEALMQVDGIQPKMPVTESTRIEFINLQSKTAATMGNLEASCTYLQLAVDAADKAGYSVWREEAADVYQELVELWPHEAKVKKLGSLFKKGA